MRERGRIDHTIVQARQDALATRDSVRALFVIELAVNLHSYCVRSPRSRAGDTDGFTMAVSAKRVAASEVDRARLEQIFNEHHASVWRALRRRGLTREAAEDATQETFLLAAERLADIQQERERAFLIGTALRLAHTLNRKTVRWELDEDMDQRFSEARDTGDTRADQQICDLVLSKVDPDLVEVFVLYELEGLTSPEIAGLLEIPLGSVASRLRRAREQFRSAAERVEKSLQREGNS
jgi:RNA polymerase sigma-70 factor (ECF subfamily)